MEALSESIGGISGAKSRLKKDKKKGKDESARTEEDHDKMENIDVPFPLLIMGWGDSAEIYHRWLCATIRGLIGV